jgi:hypothetical protein
LLGFHPQQKIIFSLQFCIRPSPLAPPYLTPSPKWGKISTVHPSNGSLHSAPILHAASRRPSSRSRNILPPSHFDQSCCAMWARTSGAAAGSRARGCGPAMELRDVSRRQNLQWGPAMGALSEPAPAVAPPPLNRTGSPYFGMGERELLGTT